MIEIFTITDISETRWDEFVTNHSNGNYCQLSSWYRIIEKTYGHRPYYLVAAKNDALTTIDKREIFGILPIIHLKQFMFVDELVSMPFVDMGGLIAEDALVEQQLINAALNIFRNLGAKKLEIRQSDGLKLFDKQDENQASIAIDPEKQVDIQLNHTFLEDVFCQLKRKKVRMILKLPQTSDLLMKSFKSKLRSQIKKPVKEGLTFKIGRDELVDDFYNIFCRNMRELGSPVHSKKLIENVLAEFGDRVAIFVVYKNSIPLAVSLTIGFKSQLSNPWASSLRQYSRLAPNMLLYWAMLEYACNRGYQSFDFGRSTIGEGTYKFKFQWGARPKDLHWYEFNLSKTNSSDFGNSTKRNTLETIWKNMPLKVVNWIGPIIRKYISL